MSANPLFIGSINNQGTSFSSADTDVPKAVWTAGASGGVLELLQVVNASANPYSLFFLYKKGAVVFDLVTVDIPASAGATDGTPPVNLIDPAILPGVNADPNRNLVLGSAEVIQMGVTGGLAGGDVLSVIALGGDY